jgi:hypothetical protein
MKRITKSLMAFFIYILINQNGFAQVFQQQFTDALAAGNLGGGTIISNAAVTTDPLYVNSPASTSQFTFLSTNNDLASIGIAGDGVMRLSRAGSGTIYVVRNTNFTGSPTALQVSFDFNAETTAGTSGGAIEFMLGQNFANSNNNPATADKHSVFFVNTKSPTGTPGTWGVTPISASSTSSFTTTETIVWVVNNGTEPLLYTAPDGSAEVVVNETYDLWVGTTKFYNDQAANSATAELNNFEIRIAGGNGIYSIDNILIETPPPPPPPVTYHFRTVASGDWISITTWESSPDGSVWSASTVTPYDTSNTITIKTGHTVTVTESVNVDQLTVETGASVLVNGTPVIFTIKDGPGAVDMLVNGLLKSQGVANASPGPHTVNAEGVLSFGNGGVFEHGQNAGAIPISEWGTGSTLKISGSTNTAPANRTQNFYNLVFDSPALTSNLNMGFTNHTIFGDITIANTNTGRWQLCGPVTDSSAVLNILGDVIHLNGNFATTGTGNGNTTIIINHFGDIIASAGNFSISRGSQGGTGTTNWYLHSGSITMSNVTTQNSNVTGARFVFTGSDQGLTISNMIYGGGGLPVRVDSGAIVNLGTSAIQGNGAFTVSDFGGINTAQDSGFVQNLLTTGAVTLSSLGNYGYKGTIPQLIGTFIPATVNGLMIANNTGVSMSGNLQVNDYVNINDGDLNLAGFTLTLGPNAILTETPGNTVNGNSGKIITTRDLNAPSGVNVGGLGAMLTSSANLGNTLLERIHYPAQGNGNIGIYRQFRIEPTNNTALDATLRFYYDESELNGISESNLTLFRSVTGADSTWNGAGGTVNSTENYLQLSGIGSLSYWTAADINNSIPVELTSFTASVVDGSVNLFWSTATELNNSGWEIERKSGKTQNEQWVKIGFVKGIGSSTEKQNYYFNDESAKSGQYNYRLKQIDFDGSYTYSNVIEVTVNGPTEFQLAQNYPNPFNPETQIRVEVPITSYVNLSVYNLIGEKVITIIDETLEQGVYVKSFSGENFPSGIYLYRLTSGNYSITKKMTLIK